LKKNGFTKVEVIIMIIISFIAIIIATPIISNLMKDATKSTFKSNAKMLIHQIEYEVLSNDSFDPNLLNVDNLSDYGFENDNYSTLIVREIDNMIYIQIEGDLMWNNLIVCGTLKDMMVLDEKDKELCIIP